MESEEGRKRLGASFAGQVDVRRSVDMRYGEQTFEIQVSLDGVDVEAKDLMEQVVERFHKRHEELYTYSAPGQDVVLVNVRAAVIGRLPALPAEQARRVSAPAAPRSRRVYLERWMEIPVYDMDGLAGGPGGEGARHLRVGHHHRADPGARAGASSPRRGGWISGWGSCPRTPPLTLPSPLRGEGDEVGTTYV